MTSTSVHNNENIITNWDYYEDTSTTQMYYVIDRWDDYFGWIIDYDSTSVSPYIDTAASVHHRNYKYRVAYKDLCGNKGPNSNIGKNIVLDGIQYVSH